jgi:hypothetical protein
MSTLRTISNISLAMSGICALIILIDLLSGHKQKMWIMNIVWTVTALYAGPLALIAYYTIGRKSLAKMKMNMPEKPFWQSVVVGTLHCGSGCTLGDLIAEFGLLLFPFAAFGSILFGSWIVDYIIAFLIGIIFQYYAIKPMKNLSVGKAIAAALKADTLSLTFWQIGMYGWMAISTFLIFHQRLHADTVLFWFMMQAGMLLGFLTAYPVNWWLIKKGIKEAM